MSLMKPTARQSHAPLPLTSLHAAAALSRPDATRAVPVDERPIRVIIADDCAVFRDTLKLLLRQAAREIVVVGEASSGPEAVEAVRRLSPDLLIMDFEMRGGDGLAATRELVDAGDAVRILVLTVHSEQDQRVAVLQAGAKAFLTKDASNRELVDAIRVVMADGVYIPPCVARSLTWRAGR
jgi:DNA-binding NarL/FixJ family response regulator